MGSRSGPIRRRTDTEKNGQWNRRKKASDWRILCFNVNNFPSERNGSEKAKLDQVKEIMTRSDADIIGITEVGRNEYNVPYEQRPSKLVGGWFKNGTANSDWLRSTSRSQYEPGGTMTVTHDRSAAHTIARGKDQMNMGRWTWIMLKGKRENKTTIITTYRATNLQQTATRQAGIIRKSKLFLTPEAAWKEDLSELINKKKREGNVIVMGDFNDDLNNEGIVEKMMDELGLDEVLNQRYGCGPNTYFRGSAKIDGIYATPGIDIRQGGYIDEVDSPGDHKSLWIDIEERHLVGAARDDRPPPILRKATCKIPSVRKKFNAILNEQVENHKIHSKTKQLIRRARANGKLSDADKEMYESIEERLRRAVAHADTKCRKARTGKTPFSPKQKQLMGAIRILKLLYLRQKMKRKKGRPTKTQIQRFKKKYNYTGQTEFPTIKDLVAAWKVASQAYNAFRPKAHEFRNTHLGNLAQEISVDTGREASTVYQELVNAENTKKHYKNIRRKEKRAGR